MNRTELQLLVQLRMAHTKLVEANSIQRPILLARIDRLLEDYHTALTTVGGCCSPTSTLPKESTAVI